MSKRTITLTNRPPVVINEDDWELIASASDKDYDNQYEFQANRISKWFIGVRIHNKDRRAIVYATYSYTSNWQNERCYLAKQGVLLPKESSTEDIINAIKEVVNNISDCEHYEEESSRWKDLIHECVSDLPAEELL